jgi:hypothetical protein
MKATQAIGLIKNTIRETREGLQGDPAEARKFEGQLLAEVFGGVALVNCSGGSSGEQGDKIYVSPRWEILTGPTYPLRTTVATLWYHEMEAPSEQELVIQVERVLANFGVKPNHWYQSGSGYYVTVRWIICSKGCDHSVESALCGYPHSVRPFNAA